MRIHLYFLKNPQNLQFLVSNFGNTIRIDSKPISSFGNAVRKRIEPIVKVYIAIIAEYG